MSAPAPSGTVATMNACESPASVMVRFRPASVAVAFSPKLLPTMVMAYPPCVLPLGASTRATLGGLKSTHCGRSHEARLAHSQGMLELSPTVTTADARTPWPRGVTQEICCTSLPASKRSSGTPAVSDAMAAASPAAS